MCRNRDGKVFAGGSSGILHPINCYMHLQINCTHASVRLHAPDLRGGGDDTVRKCSVPAGRLNIQEERVATKRAVASRGSWKEFSVVPKYCNPVGCSLVPFHRAAAATVVSKVPNV